MSTETVVVNPDETTDTDSAAQAAALKAAAEGGVTVNGEAVEAPADEPVKAERPENVPEKFWDAEKGEVNVDAVLESNRELQSQFTKDKQGEKGTEEVKQTSEETPTNAVVSAKEYFDEHGELGDEQYKQLEAAGLSRDYVDAYIEGQKAIAQSVMQEAYSAAGGSEESFKAMNEWAADNLTPEELASHNALVVNEETSQHALQTLWARYQENAPKETLLLNGDNTNVASGEYFKSSAEMQQAMSDPRYAKDESYRKGVEQKIARAHAAGVPLFG